MALSDGSSAKSELAMVILGGGGVVAAPFSVFLATKEGSNKAPKLPR